MRGNKIIKKSYLFVLIGVLLFSCQNQQKDKFSIDDDVTREKEFIACGKRISVILPDEYVHTDTFDFIYALRLSGCDIDTFKVFYSTQNKENIFLIGIAPEELPIDSLHTRYFKYFTANGMVPFFEKKYDKNDNVYYLLMTAKMKSLSLKEQVCSYSEFAYITISGKKLYTCFLTSYDPIDSFSYEEKRKIIESVRIEDVK